MAENFTNDWATDAALESVVSELVSTNRWEDAMFVNLPLIFPSGSHVTVKVSSGQKLFHVSDNGFAYREAESVGAERSFSKTAGQLAVQSGLERNARAIFRTVDRSELSRAICDVAAASWRVAEQIYAKLSDEDEDEIEDGLREKLTQIFGADRVSPARLAGASASEWEITAIVKIKKEATVFQSVSDHASSVYRASAAFHDLAALDNAPRLVAVVKDKLALGPKLGILAQAGYVIEEGQPDEVFRRVAA